MLGNLTSRGKSGANENDSANRSYYRLQKLPDFEPQILFGLTAQDLDQYSLQRPRTQLQRYF
jgi:hypothetical protein